MSGQFEGLKFLVVDDEPDLREIIKDEFEFEGATVTEAENGRKAFEIFKKEQFSVVISDIRMPGGDGVSLARDIKDINFENPIVVLITGFADIQSDEAYDFGVEGFITKPFNLGPIRENITRLLQDRKTRWAVEVSSVGAIPLKIQDSFHKLMEEKKVNIGRGGFFIEGQYLNYRVGEKIAFTFSDLEGVGQLNWVRTVSQDDYPCGMGIEILSLKSQKNVELESLIQKLKPRAFIPRK